MGYNSERLWLGIYANNGLGDTFTALRCLPGEALPTHLTGARALRFEGLPLPM